MARNISCPVSPMGSPLSHSRSPQHSNGRLSPSPISSPRATSGASTPGGGNIGTLPQCHPMTTNYLLEAMGMGAVSQSRGNSCQERKHDMFRGIVQPRLSPETVSRDYNFRVKKAEQSGLQEKKDQLYDAHLALADRVSQQLLKNPVRLNPELELSPKSSMPSCSSGL